MFCACRWAVGLVRSKNMGSVPRFQPNLRWEFEVIVVCRSSDKGTSTKKVYGSLTWGFDVDGRGKVTSHKPRVARQYPTDNYARAMFLWNMQAFGPMPQRNTTRANFPQEILDTNYWLPGTSGPAGNVINEHSIPAEDWKNIAKEHWDTEAKNRGEGGAQMGNNRYRTGNFHTGPRKVIP